MILTCPECATSYFVDDLRIPAAGRTVKCSNCGARWMAEKTVPVTAPVTAPLTTPVTNPGMADTVAAPDVAFDSSQAAEPAEPPASVASTRAPKPPGTRGRAARISGREAKDGPPVAALAAGIALVLALAAAVILRGSVVGVWPATGGAYAALGLGVGPRDLKIEALKAEPGFEGGRPVLSVSGQIRNSGKTAQEAPPLRVRLLDSSGKRVAEITARPENPHMPPGAQRFFRVAFQDPPTGAHDLDLSFVAGAKPASTPEPHAAPAPARPPAPTGPEPIEARPLPPGSPDALADHG